MNQQISKITRSYTIPIIYSLYTTRSPAPLPPPQCSRRRSRPPPSRPLATRGIFSLYR